MSLRSISRIGAVLAAAGTAASIALGVASAQTAPPVRHAPAVVTPVPAPAPIVTAPPLPFELNPFSTPAPATGSRTVQGQRAIGARRAAIPEALMASTNWRPAPAEHLPVRMPTLQEALRRLQSDPRHRGIRNANGGTIILNGSQTVPVINQTFSYGWDGTISYASTQNLQCMNMQASKTYQYIIFPPKGTAVQAGANVTTNASGNCPGTGMTTAFGATLGPAVTFSTPYGTGTDAAYSSVWAIGMKNTANNQYEAISFVVVVNNNTITTTSDSAGTIATNDFTEGSVVYMQASGLTVGDSYAFGVVYTGSATNNQCVYMVPSTTTTPFNGSCFNNSTTTINGVAATSTSLSVGWNTTTGGTAAGTYSVQIYDVTQKYLVGTTQISLQPSSGALSWTATPYNNATAGTNNNWTFAFDGSTDQSVTGIDFEVTGLTGGHSNALTISDPNGQVLVTPVVKTTGTSFGTVTLPLKAGASFFGGIGPFYPFTDVFGPTALANAGNQYTAQVYDRTSGTVVGSKNFTLLGYFASEAWSSPSTTVLQPTSGNTVNGTVLISNNGYTKLGSNNADSLVGFVLSGDGTHESVALQGGVSSTTFTDSAGRVWDATLTNAASGGTITIVPDPANASASIDATTTLSVPLTVTVTSGQCTGSATQCYVSTQIKPYHGIAYSTANGASNPLYVEASGTPTAAAGTFGMQVSAAPAPLSPDRFSQMMYSLGTAGTSSANTYSLLVTVQNPNNGIQVHSGVITFPSGFDASKVTLSKVWSCAYPTNVCSAGGSGTVGNWTVTSASVSGVSNATSNQIYIWDGCYNGNGNCGVQQNAVAGFLFTMPMWSATSGYQTTSFVSNPDGGCPKAAGGFCSNPLTSLTFSANGTTSTSPVNASGANLDATELGIFSLDPTLMTMAFAPGTIGAGITTSTTLNYTNTPTSSDPNPDYVDKIYLTVPWGAVPASPPTATGFTTTTLQAGASPSTPAKYELDATCIAGGCITSNNITGAVAPGATVPITFSYTGAQTTGSYSVTWQVEGANGGGLSSTATTVLNINSSAGTVAFTAAGGYPTGIAVGSYPAQIGSDTDTTFGNEFTYRITNSGSTNITSVAITIPYQNTFSVTPSSSLWPNSTNQWQITATPTLSGTATTSSCSAVTYSSPTGIGGTPNGSISFTCPAGAFASGKYIDVTWPMKAPYDVGSTYTFGTTLNGAVAATPSATSANNLLVALDARLTIYVPTSGSLAIARPGVGSTTTATCVGCTISGSTTTQSSGTAANASAANINFGTFTGTFTGTSLINASVISDAASPHGWNLYVSVDNNPNNSSTGTPLLQGRVNTTTSSAATGYATSMTTWTNLPIVTPASLSSTNAGTQIAQYYGSMRRGTNEALDTLMDFQVSGTGDGSTPRTVYVTYTLVPN